MEQKKSPKTTLGLHFKILAAFLGVFVLGRFSYENNQIHNGWVCAGITGAALALYLIVALGVYEHNQRISGRVKKVSNELSERAETIQEDLDKRSRKKDS